jgi:hypothetical protein
MKKIITLLLFIICLVVFGCQSNRQPKSKSPLTNILSSKIRDTVQLNTALTNIGNYARYCNTRPFHTPINSYAIPTIDLLELLSVSGSSADAGIYGIRAYLGIADSIVTSTGSIKTVPDTIKTTHLYLTPMRLDLTDSILMDAQNNQFLYDLTTPCPKTCDVSSPLYQAFEVVWESVPHP